MKFKVDRFTVEDFANGDRIERLYMSIMQPNDFVLNNNDRVYLEILDKAYPIIKSKTEVEALLLIAHLERGKWKSQIENIYHDSMRLYDAFNISAKMIKAIATRRLLVIANDMTLLYENVEVDNSTKTKAADVARKALVDVMRSNPDALEDKEEKGIAEPENRVPSLPKGFKIHPMYQITAKEEKGGEDETN